MREEVQEKERQLMQSCRKDSRNYVYVQEGKETNPG